MSNAQMTKLERIFGIRASDFIRHWVFRHSSFNLMTWYIHIQRDDGDGIHCRLPTVKPILIGREDECNIRIMGPRVSRKHCQLEYTQGQWTASDLGSRNGTKINGKKVREAVVREGDELRVGDAFISIIDQAEEESRSIVIAIPADSASMSLVDEGVQLEISEDEPSDVEPPSTGASLEDRYELDSPFHSGATGLFYRALHKRMNRHVCVKILAQRYTENEDDLKRLLRGVKTASVLHHPNIVQIHDAGQSKDGNWWLAMEYVDGPSARSLAADVGIGKMLSPERVMAIGRDIATAMQVSYERQIVHRNITPDNILLTMDGVAKLSNFTLARGVVLETLHQITAASETVGELAYLAPEATEPDQPIDCRVDIYGLGACMYVLLTGKPPFVGRGKVDVIEKIRHEEPVAPSKHNLSIAAPLEGFVMKCLEKKLTDRYPNPQAILEELERIEKHGH